MKVRVVFAVSLFLLFAATARAGEQSGDRELARKAIAAIRAAGLDPVQEVQTEWVSRAVLSSRAQQAVQAAGLELEAVCIALTAYPPRAGDPPPDNRPPDNRPPDNRPPDNRPPDNRPPDNRPPDQPPPPAGNHGAPDGFGQKARGASGAARNIPANAGALEGALRQGGNMRLAAGDIDCAFNRLKMKGDSTLDGGGATLWFPGNNHNGMGLGVIGHNIIIRNLRIRNSGDAIFFGSGVDRAKTRDVLVENVSLTGCGDDGFSVAYGCRDITARWCLLAGNTRAIFVKYGGGNFTLHHSIISHFWIRAPLVHGREGRVDIRNNLIQYWSWSASMCDAGATGDFVNNTYRQAGWAGGKPNTALYPWQGGQVYSSGNQFDGCSQRPAGMSNSPIVNAPAVPTEDAAAALRAVLDDNSGAGCMPRDQVDRNYLAAQQRCPSGTPAVGLQVEGSRGGR